MNSKERVEAALAHRQPDRTPYSIGLTQKAAARLAAHLGTKDWQGKLGVVNDLVGFGPGRKDDWIEIRPGYWRDGFGVVWNRTVDKDIGNPEPSLRDKSDLDRLNFPDPKDPALYAHLPGQLAAHTDRFCSIGIGFSLFERAWTLRGMAELMMDMTEDPEFVDALLDKILDWNLAVIDACAKLPCDEMHFGDDWGQQRGLLMGPKLWRRFIKPRVAKMYGRVKAAGKKVSIHSCGDVAELFPDLIEAGLDLFNPFQPEVMDVVEMKRKFGDRLSFWGGISTQKTLPYGTPADVKREVRERCKVIGASGGYICAPAHAVPGDAPPENIVALVEALNE